MLRGLFVGVDRYQAPIGRLSCAVSDAQALACLFEDTLGGTVSRLLDKQATGDAVRSELASLQSVAEDDLVVISFSGHGTEDHQLVPVDADPDRVDETCIPLTELAELLDSIPSKNLMVFLDCCFSGGFGGSRAFAPTAKRAMLEDRSSVRALARGDGRIVITASGAGEPALETISLGHGLLSNYLILGLQGAEDLLTAGRLPLMALFEWVLRQVQHAAERMHETQTPTLYGSLEGAPTLTPLRPGDSFALAFPGSVRPPASSDWKSLTPYGIKSDVLDLWAAGMTGLNELQVQAINDYRLLDGQSMLVVAPTGAGKTMIGEMTALQAVGQRSRAVMLLPLKALVNDKYDAMRSTYGASLAIVRATGDHSDQIGDLLGGHYDIALLTYEKFTNLAIGMPHILRGISVVIVDEAQILADKNRGPNLEFMLTALRSGIGRGDSPQIVALSAVIGDTGGLERWLGGGLLRTEARPVPLRERVVDSAGTVRTLEPDGKTIVEARAIKPEYFGGSESSKPFVVPLVRAEVAAGKKVIVFRATKGEAVGTAQYLAELLGLSGAPEVLELLPEGDQSSASQQLRNALRGGIGFHTSDLDATERAVLESAFRDTQSNLRVLTATTTLAMGINTPAETVIIVGLNHFPDPYTVAEYKNMAGRAGRPGHTEAGESYIVATASPPADVAWGHYVLGQAEDLRSQLLTGDDDPRGFVLRSLLVLGASVEEGQLIDLLNNSFAMWQRVENGAATGWDASSLSQNVNSLIEARLVDREPSGRLTLTGLGRWTAESGLAVQSVVNVASLLRYSGSQVSAADLLVLAQVTTELDDVALRTQIKSHQEQARWPRLLSQFGVSQSLLQGLHVGGGSSVRRAKRAAACLMLTSRQPFAELERALLQHTPERSAAGPIRAVASRTRDVIDTVANICLYYGKVLAEDIAIDDLALQLELGIPQEAVVIATVAGAQLARADYLQLVDGGLTDWRTIADVSDDVLRERVGNAKARLLKEYASRNFDNRATEWR